MSLPRVNPHDPHLTVVHTAVDPGASKALMDALTTAPSARTSGQIDLLCRYGQTSLQQIPIKQKGTHADASPFL
jgi:hypothetical protein